MKTLGLYRQRYLKTLVYVSCRFCHQKHLKEDLNKLLLKMPKQPQHTGPLQKIRQKMKEKNVKYPAGTVTLQVLGAGKMRSVYIFTDQTRYMFNCGEGTQRLAHEHKMKLAKLEHVFITHNSWENIGGLPGLALTVQDVGVPEIVLHGPPGLDELFFATRRFVVLKDLNVKSPNSNEGCYEDHVLRVDYVSVTGKERVVSVPASPMMEDSVDYYAYERKGESKEQNGRPKTSERGEPSPKRACLESVQCSQAISYICRLQKKPGALLLEKCVEKGVPAGPLLGKLKAGEDVTLENGTVVQAAEVCSPNDPGPVFLVVECPSEDFLQGFVNDTRFTPHQSTAKSEDDVAGIVLHFTPPHIMQMPTYCEWMAKFPPSTVHVALSLASSNAASEAVHRIQHKLHLLHPDVFPLLGEIVGGDAENGTGCNSDQDDVLLCGNVPALKGQTLLSFHLRPKKGLARNTVLVKPEEYVEEALASEDFVRELDLLKTLFQSQTGSSTSSFPQIVFLGTGSCIPNKTRNTSGILLRLSEEASILLDCGEGTYIQLVRFFGEDNVDRILRGLRAIYVSHLHADHHLGLIGVLRYRKRAFRSADEPYQRALLLAPYQISTWLNFYHQQFESILDDIQLIPNAKLVLGKDRLEENVKNELLECAGLRDVATVHVRHCPNAFGVALTLQDGWKMVYSGDTMPCEGLASLGQGCDLLIHEATMEDELVDEAKIKLHSTTSQAIEMGHKMDARFLILTHFSQRYAKIPRITQGLDAKVGIAFDNMVVRLADLPILPSMYTALKYLFAEHCEELEQKAAKRLQRNEKLREVLAKQGAG